MADRLVGPSDHVTAHAAGHAIGVVVSTITFTREIRYRGSGRHAVGAAADRIGLLSASDAESRYVLGWLVG